MSTVQNLLRQEHALKASLVAFDEAVGDRAMTDDEKAEFDKIETDIKATQERRERAERAEAARLATAKPLEPTAGIEMGRNRAEDEPWANDTRMAFGKFLQAVHTADPRVNGTIDPRLHKHAAATGSNSTVGSEGGFLVGTDETTELNKIMFESAMLASRCQQVEISSGSNSISTRMIDETSRVAGSRFGGVDVGWASEAGTTDASKPKFRLVDQKLAKLMGIWYCTEEELADASYIASVAANAFGEEMAFALDEAIYRGDGSGKPLGMLACPALVTVAKESGQEAATIYYDNVLKMYSRMPASSLLRSAWYVSPDSLPQLMTMTLEVGTGGQPVYLPPNGAADAPFGTLLGRPVYPNEHSNTVGTVGDIVLADLGWYRLISKGGVNAATSIHVRFVYDESTFRFTYRVNGTPMIASAITPAQGSNTVSPFVALATRS